MHVPQVQVGEKTNEIPQLQTIEKIVDIPEIQTLEAVLQEFDDEELCCDDLEETCNMTRMNRKRLWRRVWHGCSSPPDASKSERSWRRLSKCLCYDDEFDEMKRTCAYCGRFEDEDDIFGPLPFPSCSFRSVDHTDAVRLLWATQEVHTGSQMISLPRLMSTLRNLTSQTRSMRAMKTFAVSGPRRNASPEQGRLASEVPLVVKSLNMWVGDTHVRLLSETAIETQIKFSDDDEWQPPVVLTLLHRDGSSERNWSVPLPAGAATVDGVIVPAGCDETSSSELGWHSA